MKFDLTDEQEQLQHVLHRFFERELPLPRLHAIFDGPDGHDTDLWQGLMAMGLGGIAIDEAYGGSGLELLDLAVAAEILGYYAAPGPFWNHALCGIAIQLAGSETQKATWLPRLASGEVVGGIALGEAGGWQPEDWTLAPSGPLTGRKETVCFAGQCDVFVVGLAGGGLGLVEAGSGVSATMLDGIDGTRRIGTLDFDNAACEMLPGGAAISGRLRDAGLALLAADAFGGAQRCIAMATDYAKIREQFGTTIGHFQALKHQLADMAQEIEPARGLYWFAAHAFDHLPDEAERAAAIAKAHLTDRYMQVSRHMIEAHGGIAYTWEHDAHIWLKRAMLDRAMLGAPSVHRTRAAELAGW